AAQLHEHVRHQLRVTKSKRFELGNMEFASRQLPRKRQHRANHRDQRPWSTATILQDPPVALRPRGSRKPDLSRRCFPLIGGKVSSSIPEPITIRAPHYEV